MLEAERLTGFVARLRHVGVKSVKGDDSSRGNGFIYKVLFTECFG